MVLSAHYGGRIPLVSSRSEWTNSTIDRLVEDGYQAVPEWTFNQASGSDLVYCPKCECSSERHEVEDEDKKPLGKKYKCLMVDGYLCGDSAREAMGILGLDDLCGVEGIPFQWDGGYQMHLVVVKHEGTVPKLSSEDAWNICGDEEVYDTIYLEELNVDAVVPSKPVSVEYKGNTYLMVASIHGMDKWGLRRYER